MKRRQRFKHRISPCNTETIKSERGDKHSHLHKRYVKKKCTFNLH